MFSINHALFFLFFFLFFFVRRAGGQGLGLGLGSTTILMVELSDFYFLSFGYPFAVEVRAH